MFTITKNTHTGLQEVLTDVGFRSRESLKNKPQHVLRFNRKEGSKKIMELRKQSRNKTIARSIILNYA